MYLFTYQTDNFVTVFVGIAEKTTALKEAQFGKHSGETHFLAVDVIVYKALQIGKSLWLCVRTWAKFPWKYLKSRVKDSIVEHSAH